MLDFVIVIFFGKFYFSYGSFGGPRLISGANVLSKPITMSSRYVHTLTRFSIRKNIPQQHPVMKACFCMSLETRATVKML